MKTEAPKRMSIHDAMLEAISKGRDEKSAITYCRARLHIPRVSTKRLREYYATTKSTLEKPI